MLKNSKDYKLSMLIYLENKVLKGLYIPLEQEILCKRGTRFQVVRKAGNTRGAELVGVRYYNERA